MFVSVCVRVSSQLCGETSESPTHIRPQTTQSQNQIMACTRGPSKVAVLVRNSMEEINDGVAT